jgi:recombination protein RecA
MTEAYRQSAIRRKLARMENRRTSPAIPTGFRALDEVLGAGGLPRGHIVEWFGPPSCGKTTLALQTVAHLQESGSVAAWIDADRTFDPSYAVALGVTLERLPVARPESAEEALEMARQLLDSGAVDLLVVDSAAALTPSLELGAGIGDSGAGLHGRVLASGLRKMCFTLRRSGSAAIFVNQSRTRLDAAAGELETSAGGPALKLYAPVRLAFHPENGRRLRLRALKNNAAAAFKGGVLDWREGAGFADTL